MLHVTFPSSETFVGFAKVDYSLIAPKRFENTSTLSQSFDTFALRCPSNMAYQYTTS